MTSTSQLIYFIDIRELACPFAVLNHMHARSVHADERTYARAPLSAHARPQVDPPTNVATQTATTHADRTSRLRRQAATQTAETDWEEPGDRQREVFERGRPTPNRESGSNTRPLRLSFRVWGHGRKCIIASCVRHAQNTNLLVCQGYTLNGSLQPL